MPLPFMLRLRVELRVPSGVRRTWRGLLARETPAPLGVSINSVRTVTMQPDLRLVKSETQLKNKTPIVTKIRSEGFNTTTKNISTGVKKYKLGPSYKNSTRASHLIACL